MDYEKEDKKYNKKKPKLDVSIVGPSLTPEEMKGMFRKDFDRKLKETEPLEDEEPVKYTDYTTYKPLSPDVTEKLKKGLKRNKENEG